MRRLLLLVPLVLVGCRSGRQATVSSTGSVASTTEAGTFVTGNGKVAEGGSDVAWSPDGGTLAIATKGGVLLWPEGDRLSELEAPLAWTPYGDGVAGISQGRIVVRNLKGDTRTTTITGTPKSLGWTKDGRLFGVDEKGVQLDGGARLTIASGYCADAVATPDGGLLTIQWTAQPRTLDAALKAEVKATRWTADGTALSTVSLGKAAEMLGTSSSRRVVLPVDFSLAPDGDGLVAVGVQVDGGARTMTRLKALTNKSSLSAAETNERDRLLGTVKTKKLIVRVELDGRTRTLWTAPQTRDEWGPTDLEWSPDGKWLAIAQKDGTIRIAAE